MNNRKLKHLSLLLACGTLALCATQAMPAEPQRVLIIGDSMMRVTAHALELELSRQTGIVTRAYTSLGSGLARLDVFDWMAKTRELSEAFVPDYTFVWFGTNDRQPMLAASGNILRPDQPEWEEEYARRVGNIMDILTTRADARVGWLELPDMREPNIQADVELINRIVKTQAAARAGVDFLPTRQTLSRVPGKFSAYVIGSNGLPLPVRDPDGVHLNRAGADRLVKTLVTHLADSAEP